MRDSGRGRFVDERARPEAIERERRIDRMGLAGRHLMGEDLITHLGLDYYEDLVEDVIS